MPETTVHLDDGAALRKGEVRPSGKLAQVHAISVSQAMQKPPDQQLWFGVDPLVAAHDRTHGGG
jgi:hypothetical protein